MPAPTFCCHHHEEHNRNPRKIAPVARVTHVETNYSRPEKTKEDSNEKVTYELLSLASQVVIDQTSRLLLCVARYPESNLHSSITKLPGKLPCQERYFPPPANVLAIAASTSPVMIL